MRCEEVKQQFAEYLARTLDADVAVQVERHTFSCADCQTEFAAFEALWRALGDGPTPSVPSNRMRERFSAMLAAERASTDRRPASRRQIRGGAWTPSVWLGEPLVHIAAAASLLVGGVLAGRAMTAAPSVQQPATEIAEMRSELRDMRQMLTLSLMQQQSATERLRGVSWTAQLDQPGGEIVSALLDTLLHDPNVNVRLAAVDALRRFSDRPEVRLGTKRAMADGASPLLQVAVIDFMVETRDPQASDLLRALVDNPSLDESVRGRAQWGLERLAS